MKHRVINVPIVEGSLVKHKFEKYTYGKVERITNILGNKSVYIQSFDLGIPEKYIESVEEVDDDTIIEEDIMKMIVDKTDITGVNLKIYTEKFRLVAKEIVKLIENGKTTSL